jgi:tellurite resistance protein TerC
VWAIAGPQYAGEFFAGWITEYSPLDRQPLHLPDHHDQAEGARQLQQFALLVGIILALIFRGVFIAVGAAVINAFSWVFFIFGAFLVWTAVKIYLDYRKHDEDTGHPT